MAKIQWSALVNKMSGSLEGSVLRTWKGIQVISKKNNSPRQARSEAQQNIRGTLTELAGEFYSLTTVQKELWNSWVSMSSSPMTALNAYVKFNQLLQKYFPGTARKTSPPTTPGTPTFPLGFSVAAQAASDFSIAWTSPTLTTLFVIADYWAMPGRDNNTKPKWAFGASASSETLFVAVATEYPVDTVVKFRIRTIDADARVSPWSHILSGVCTA